MYTCLRGKRLNELIPFCGSIWTTYRGSNLFLVQITISIVQTYYEQLCLTNFYRNTLHKVYMKRCNAGGLLIEFANIRLTYSTIESDIFITNSMIHS